MTSTPIQYTDSKISRNRKHACEQVPHDLHRAWAFIDWVSPSIMETQVPPMATYLAAPTMADAVAHTVRVARIIAIIEDAFQRNHA